MAATTKPLLSWLQTLRTQAAENKITETALEKHRTVISAIIKSGDNLNFAISAAKICPAAVDVKELTRACREYAPALIDALLPIEGVDRFAIQSDIICRQHPQDAMARMESWYPGSTPFPQSIQRLWSEVVHDLCKKETSTGTAYQRRLTQDTGAALEQAVAFIGNKITDPSAVTWVIRASHHVLRGMSRTVPILHGLPQEFAQTTLEAMWTYAMDQKDNPHEWRINAQAFTLANTEALPEARSWLTMHYPNESAVVNKLWDKHAIQVSTFFSNERKRYGITSTIVQREGDWTPPEDSAMPDLSASMVGTPMLTPDTTSLPTLG